LFAVNICKQICLDIRLIMIKKTTRIVIKYVIYIIRALYNPFERQLWAFWVNTHPAEASGRLSGQILNCLAQSFTACEALRPSFSVKLNSVADI